MIKTLLMISAFLGWEGFYLLNWPVPGSGFRVQRL